MLANDCDLPDDDTLRQHILATRAALRNESAGWGDTPSYSNNCVHTQRFNMTADAMCLLRQENGASNPTPRHTFVEARSVYIRGCMKPMHMYAFNAVDSKKFFFVAENKTFAGRAVEKDATVSTGRHLSIVWFEPVSVSEWRRLKPVTDVGSSGSLPLTMLTPHGLMTAAGIHIDFAADTTMKARETGNEERFFDYVLVCYVQTRHLLEDGTGWHFEVDDPIDAEDAFFQELPAACMTKTVIARHLARQKHGGSHVHWKRLANYSKAELAEQLSPGVAMAVAVAAPDGAGGDGAPVPLVGGRGRGGAAAPVKGRGKGRAGRGRGRGRVGH